jgi:hypothetical protein
VDGDVGDSMTTVARTALMAAKGVGSLFGKGG